MSLYDVLNKYPQLNTLKPQIESAYNILVDTYGKGCKLLICGNGGSAADSEHIAAELMKGFLLRRELSKEQKRAFGSSENGAYIADNLQNGLPAISLSSHTGFLTAFTNDCEADMAFAQQVFVYGRTGDCLLALSTSGNSRNVCLAVETARAIGMKIIGMTGNSGGSLAGLCDAAIRVPSDITHEIQELHLPIYHLLCLMLEDYFYNT